MRTEKKNEIVSFTKHFEELKQNSHRTAVLSSVNAHIYK